MKKAEKAAKKAEKAAEKEKSESWSQNLARNPEAGKTLPAFFLLTKNKKKNKI